ncbi:hypothetical protein ACNOYE_11230 [Nannocystaceae bacterium ST9]
MSARFASELGFDPRCDERFVTKAPPLRALIEAIRVHGLEPVIVACVPHEVERWFRAPPQPGEWVPAIDSHYLLCALDRVVGPAGVRAVARTATLGLARTMRPLIECMLRLLDATPHAFFARSAEILGSQVEGVHFEHLELERTRGGLLVRYDYLLDPPDCAFVYWLGVVETTIDLCGKRLLDATVLRSELERDTANVIVAWR